MKNIKGVRGDTESVDTESTRSLSDSDDESVDEIVDERLGKTAGASSTGFFKVKPTALRLQRSDAREALAINKRLIAIHQEKEANAVLIREKKATFMTLRAEHNELSDKTRQEAEMLKQLIELKEEENRLLNAKIVEEKEIIKPLYAKIIKKENSSLLSTSPRKFRTALSHMIGFKASYNKLRHKTVTLFLAIDAKEKTVKANIDDIAEQTETVKLNAKDYRLRRNEIEKESHACLGERKLLEANNKALENEEKGLISLLPTFQNKQKELSLAIDKLIESCEKLTKKSMLSRMQKDAPSSPQAAVAHALSEFLKNPTETTQEALAMSIKSNPTCIEEPKLQKLLDEAKNYYSEVGEMVESDDARPNM